METSNIMSSTMIKKVTFDDGDMVVYFTNGNDASYSNVPRNIYEDFIKASSIGKYYNANIKGKYND